MKKLLGKIAKLMGKKLCENCGNVNESYEEICTSCKKSLVEKK